MKFFLKNKDLGTLKSNVSKFKNPALKNAALGAVNTEFIGGTAYSRAVEWGKLIWSRGIIIVEE